MRRAAIGFADHTGWAIAVVVAEREASFDVLCRERLQLLDPSLPAQAYHAVTERGMPPEVIKVVEESALACALNEVTRLWDLVTTAGFEDVSIEPTHLEVDKMYGAIVRARKP